MEKRFECYRVASALTEKSAEVQVSTLVYAMGGDAKDVLASFGISAEDIKDNNKVLAEFEKHFVAK